MKFARLGEHGSEIPVVVDGDRYLDLRPITADVTGAFLADDPVGRASAAMALGHLPMMPISTNIRLGPPIARPSAVVCVGMNYAAHAAESNAVPPREPVVFLKTPNSVAGPNDNVVIPRGSEKTDWEVELGVVIGRRVSYLDSPSEALDHIAGFVAANDVSERDFQLEVSGGQWSKGKCAPGFAPLGPWLVTPDEVAPDALRLRSWVNGEIRQDSSTSDMIFPVDYLLWHLSQFVVLDPGDLVLTGTPAGVALSGRFPYLAPGDIVDIEIEGLGAQQQRFVAWKETR